MSAVDTRSISRDSLFLLAEVSVAEGAPVRVKVRNLSSGGMMAEGNVHPQRGAKLSVNLRNVGWVGGTVAWTQDDRFGIAFDEEIDPKSVRAPAQAGADYEPPRFARPAVRDPRFTGGPARKI